MTLYRPREIAERWGLHRSTIYRLIRSGVLDHVRIGTAVRVPEGSLEKFIK